MIQKKYDWSRFSKRININANTQTIFDAWTKQEDLEKWFLCKAEFHTTNNSLRAKNDTIQTGDIYEWMWHGSDFVANGKVLATNGKDRLQFTFFDCPVTVTIQEEAGENVVELCQENIPIDEESIVNLHLGCSRGWTFYLANIKSILEGGIDLRNRNKGLIDVINT